jgi:hypothetical protein
MANLADVTLTRDSDGRSGTVTCTHCGAAMGKIAVTGPFGEHRPQADLNAEIINLADGHAISCGKAMESKFWPTAARCSICAESGATQDWP